MSNPSELKRRFIASVIQFLNDEMNSGELSPESRESLEVATQCLGTAYAVNPVDGTLPFKKPILEIVSNHLENNNEHEKKKEISEEDKAKANELKNEGNELMKNEKFQEALKAYTKAIQLDDSNPIFYCNRAAAHSKLENHKAALEDCKIAIKNDPNYSKAYCRMGLAYVRLNDHQRALDCYKKAYELDPTESNKNNLNLAEQKVQEEMAQAGMFGGGGFANIMNNPQLMNMANMLMSDPNMQNIFSQLSNAFMGAQGGRAQSGQPNDQSSDSTESPLNVLLQTGQQLADQMKNANPELVEQLKKMKNAMDGNKDSKDKHDDDEKPQNI